MIITLTNALTQVSICLHWREHLSFKMCTGYGASHSPHPSNKHIFVTSVSIPAIANANAHLFANYSVSLATHTKIFNLSVLQLQNFVPHVVFL